jgi:hypothetical protein
MVQQALNRHSAIAVPPETKFFFSFLGHSRRHQARHVNRLNQDLGIALESPRSAIRSDDAARAFYETMAEQYVTRLDKRTVKWFGEKTPEHTSHLTRIRQVFPDAKVIVLYRDGRDVALSLSKAPWMRGGLYVSFVVWLYYQRLVMQAWERQIPNLYFARYEDIVAQPRTELAAMLEFLELPDEPAVANGWGNREGIPVREDAWKANALRRICSDRVGVFRSELNEMQIAILERLGRRTLSSFGYPLLTDGRNRLSAGFLCRLGAQMTMFLSELPWFSLMQEMTEQMFI